MERLTARYRDALKAIGTLGSILDEPFSEIVRDAAIQRFEYTFEAFWKFLKHYLRASEGVVCNSPKSCFRESCAAGLMSEDETVSFLEMTDDRNMTAHTYKEEVAQAIYDKLRGYSRLLETVAKRVKM